MINLKIELTWEQVFPAGAYLAEIRPRYPYINGTRGAEIEGYNYIVVSRKGFDKVTIKTADKVPKMTPEELEQKEEDVVVTAKGFVGKIYTTKDGNGISAVAEEVILS